MDKKLLVIGGTIIVLIIGIAILFYIGQGNNRARILFQNEEQFYDAMKVRLGLSPDATVTEIHSALELPENATPEMVFQAMREKFGNEFDFNRGFPGGNKSFPPNGDFNRNFQDRRSFE